MQVGDVLVPVTQHTLKLPAHIPSMDMVEEEKGAKMKDTQKRESGGHADWPHHFKGNCPLMR